MSKPSKEAMEAAREIVLRSVTRANPLEWTAVQLDAFARSRVEEVARQRDAVDKDRQALLDAHMNWERDKRRAVEAEREACLDLVDRASRCVAAAAAIRARGQAHAKSQA